MMTKALTLLAALAMLAGCSSADSDTAGNSQQSNPLDSKYSVTDLNDNSVDEEIMASEAETETKPVYVDPIVQADETEM